MSQPKNTPNLKIVPPNEPNKSSNAQPVTTTSAIAEKAEPTKTRAVDGKTIADLKEESKTNPPAMVIITGKPLGKYFLINKQTMVLGRELTADICIPETSISRKHSEFTITENGVIAKDLGSTNGTFINDKKLEPHVPQILGDGDLIRCGNTLFKFVREGQIETRAGLRNYDYSTDSLTGIFNRKAIIETIQEEFTKSKMRNTPLSFVLFDIDHFKKINDTYGHPAGDYVLKETCDLIKNKMIRQRDTLGRYGGEEFALVLPEIPSQIAIEVAERIRAAVEKHDFIFEGQQILVRISLGVVALDSSSKTPDELIALADKALYEAKNTGRNRVCVR
jgi:two-component system, cell cycle response regulator